MAKPFSGFCVCVSILAIILFVVVMGSSNHDNYNKAFAVMNASVSIPIAKQDTFSVIGTISSLVITVPTPVKSTALAGADAGFNITNASF
jgi:uncharacterized membrane protein